MSDPSAFGFGKFVPGFDFLQNLARTASQPSTAGNAIPGMSSWVAPTLSIEELDKRIQELKTVQFWLEQNGTALKATIQALEVQKMTLTTLQGMNVNMAELAKAFTAKAPASAAAPPAAEPAVPPQAPPEPAPATQATSNTESTARRGSSKSRAQAQTAGATVDPMQWWGSLTQQFQNIASAAMQDVAAQATKAKAATRPGHPQSADKASAQATPRKAAGRKTPVKKPGSGKTRSTRS